MTTNLIPQRATAPTGESDCKINFTPNVATLTDRELIVFCQREDILQSQKNIYFEEIYQRFYTNVRSVCRRMMRHDQLIEEAIQEVFLRVYTRIGQFSFQAEFTTWLHRISVNTCLNYLRKLNKQVEATDWELRDDQIDLRYRMPSVEQEFFLRERTNRIANAVDNLHPSQQEIFRLRYYNKMPYSDISDKLGISVSAAKMRFTRARDSLKVHLSRDLLPG